MVAKHRKKLCRLRDHNIVKWQEEDNLVTSVMFFIQGKPIHRLGEYSASQAVKHISWRISGKSEFYRELDEATRKQDMVD